MSRSTGSAGAAGYARASRFRASGSLVRSAFSQRFADLCRLSRVVTRHLPSVVPGVRLHQAGRRFEVASRTDGWEVTPLPRTGGAPARTGVSVRLLRRTCQPSGGELTAIVPGGLPEIGQLQWSERARSSGG